MDEKLDENIIFLFIKLVLLITIMLKLYFKRTILVAILFSFSFVYSQPGKNGVYNVTSANQVVNKYCPVAANISAGANTVTLSTGPGFSLCPGDLIMIYQAQGANVDGSNTSSYGNILNYNSAGLYEFKYVQSINGNVVTVQTTFTNSYATAGRVQAIKVPQYTTLTINTGASIVAKPWRDTTILAVPYRFGGLVVIHASNITNNGTIASSGSGFRGGQLDDQTYGWGVTSYVSGVTTDGGEKGESIAGFQTDYDANGGRYCMGAVANGGGGGNTHNSAAGGGANGNNGNAWSGHGIMVVDPNNPLAAWALDPAYISNGNALTNSSGGGRGGYSFGGGDQNALVSGPGNPVWGGDNRREVGGRGGRPLNNINAETRIYFGGGGGAGDANNNCSTDGGNGGGIVYLIATGGITGNGTIVSNGNFPGNTQLGNNDAASGGGAGGSIVIKTTAIAATQVVNANGGNGGNQLFIVSESEGAGGGGGGGFAAISVGPVVPTVNGGNNGNSQSTSVTEMTSNGATRGAVGNVGTVSSNFIPFNAIPQPVIAAPTVTQTSCTSTLNAFNLNLVFNPSNPSYTINWSPLPSGVTNNTQTSASGGIAPGVYNATILLGGACSSLVTSFTINPPPTPISFTVFPTYSLTCSQQTVFASLNPANSYTWSSSFGPPLTGPTVSFTPASAGVWTVVGVNPSGCTLTQTFSVIQNTVAPVNAVNPVSQAITCNSGAPVTFSGTVSSPTINIQHDWYSPLNPLPGGVPIATSNNTISILSGAVPPGVYTLVTTNQVNGCTTQKTVTITSLSAWPTFNVSSPTNFSVGCAPLNQTTISIINPVSTQTPPATCSYTFLPPSFIGLPTPSIILGSNTSTVTTIPGTWTVIVQDNSNWCRTILTVPILQNTVAPNVSASVFTPTLTCYNPTVLATGTSTTPNTTITWNVPSVPPNLSTSTLIIGDPANGPNTSTNSLSYANFTVVATNSLNACQSTSVLTIYQNFKPPISSPTISIATPTAIYCLSAGAPVVLTTGNSTTTSGGGPSAFAVPYMWQGPSPQFSVTGASSYSAYVAGVYSLTIRDNYNGCFSTGTVNVLDKTQPPVVTNAMATSTLDCGTSQASLLVAITGPSTGLMYWFYKYPVGSAFSPTNATNANGSNPYLSGTSSASINVSNGGYYEYVVTNTLTGCQATGTFFVANGDVTAEFDADKMTGASPLTVNFTNNSHSSLSTNSITSVWSFGNGTSQTTTSNINVNSLYNASGTYTVMLYVTKGLCKDTVFKVIVVDQPSKLEVPNIFTPNGDGSNDVFFLKTASITQVSAVILDRWGNKVYETNSSTGNIAWDGKNFAGAECAAGVYFYIISGKGKDDKEYSAKGNVTLIR